ncbi:MAG: hypothetical protein LBQ82_09045 [Treponema sp.]|jgi:hypothetical protein|nr:hypothetical protein [Treponema sp.]
MKKFFFTFFVLIVIGGAVFLCGWAQLSVPPGSYGVIISKTHGVDPSPVHSGEFRWIWYKLIPTNVKIAVFHPETKKFDVNFKSSLPSGDSYAAFAGLGVDFSWDLKAVMSFGINPDILTSVVSKQNIMNQDELDGYLQEIAQNVEVIIMSELSSGEIDVSRLEKLLSGIPDVDIERKISGAFPEIQNYTLLIQSARFPDFILYKEIRLLYEEFLAKQREYISTGFGRRAENLITTRLHFEELERYGELLTKYPVLLEYLALEKGGKE